MTLKGHANTITGLRISPDGTHLLSNAMVRPREQDSLPEDNTHQDTLLKLVSLLQFVEAQWSELALHSIAQPALLILTLPWIAPGLC